MSSFGVSSSNVVRERAEARVGATLCSKYRIDRVVGVGGMAAVYAATHRNGRQVAVKMLHEELSLRSDVRARFLQEGRAANAVDHPGVVAVLDDDITDDGSALLVMELLDGRVVEQIWADNGQRLPPMFVLAVARELCDVLEAAHSAGVLHRDIKPENLFLTREGRLKVLDFGLARVRDGARPKLTATGMVFGTPAFMAPEQASGRTSKIDARTDLWAVGATMFTLLSGHTVHDGESAQHLVVRAATRPPRSLAMVLPEVAPEIVHIVDRALSFKKQARWCTASELRHAIRETSEAVFGEADLDLAVMQDLTRVQTRGAEYGEHRFSTDTTTETRVPGLVERWASSSDSRNLPGADSAPTEPRETRLADEPTPPDDTEEAVDEPTRLREDMLDERALVPVPLSARAPGPFARPPLGQADAPDTTAVLATLPLPALSGRNRALRATERARIALLLGPPVLALLVISIWIGTHRRLSTTEPAGAATVSAEPAASWAATELAQQRALSPPSPSTPNSAPSAASSGSSTAPPIAEPTTSAAPSGPKPASARPSKPSAPATGSSQARCSPPYDTDGNGVRRWKLDCL